MARQYELYVPLNYNDGSPIEPEKIANVRNEILREFGNLTSFLNPTKAFGQWAV